MKPKSCQVTSKEYKCGVLQLSCTLEESQLLVCQIFKLNITPIDVCFVEGKLSYDEYYDLLLRLKTACTKIKPQKQIVIYFITDFAGATAASKAATSLEFSELIPISILVSAKGQQSKIWSIEGQFSHLAFTVYLSFWNPKGVTNKHLKLVNGIILCFFIYSLQKQATFQMCFKWIDFLPSEKLELKRQIQMRSIQASIFNWQVRCAQEVDGCLLLQEELEILLQS